MTIEILAKYRAGDTLLLYVKEPLSNRIGLTLVPAAMEARIVPHRPSLSGSPEIDLVPFFNEPPAIRVVPLVQLKLVGDAYSASFAQGRSMLFAESNDRFALIEQTHTHDGDQQAVTTILQEPAGLRLRHVVRWHDGDAAVIVHSTFENHSAEPVTLEMFSSFSIGGITPFDAADAPGRLRAHRLRSTWSAEGRLDTQSIEQLHLERSWAGITVMSERFGQVGSAPVRGWFPFAAIEDTVADVTWGAQLAWAGSWQMEVARQHDDVVLAGGLADREFGQWCKTIAPGETFAAPPATLACVHGDLDALCDRLTAVQHRAADAQPAIEHDLPIIFNEWCTTWGHPTHDRIIDISKRLRGTATKYLVIDDGWFTSESGEIKSSHGDWIVNRERFPNGLEATAAAIREQGLIPGLWFEFETVARHSAGFGMTDLLLQRDGLPITVGGRRFWDMNHPAVIDRLSERVIDMLRRCGIGYMKVDYNETIGIGSARDAAGSLGEGLRRQIEGVHRFFDRIRSELPDLVIENCASGGHRLDPSMIGRTAMSSFSDAHELLEIPIIAASLQRLILPRQSQIWAVLHASDSDRRLIYSLAATFLGRMCLSGEIDRLSDAQMDIVRVAHRLYQDCAPIIKHGRSRRSGSIGESWRHPQGWQAVLRLASDKRDALVVTHRFGNGTDVINIPLHAGQWRIAGELIDQDSAAEIIEGRLRLSLPHDFSAAVIRLRRD